MATTATPETRELIEVDSIDLIYEDDGSVMNPRGADIDSTDLQPSMRKSGQFEPIIVMRDPQTGRHLLLDGNRRLVSAKALGWTLIEATFKPFKNDRAAQRAMMIAAQLHQQPKPSHFGRSLARQQIEDGWSVERVATIAGKTPREVEILIALAFATADIQAKVDSGEMKLSTFSEIMTKPQSVQAKIGKLEKPTVRNVRTALRKERVKSSLTKQRSQPSLDEAVADKPAQPTMSAASPFNAVLEQLAEPTEDEIEALIVAPIAVEFYNMAKRLGLTALNDISRDKIAAAIALASAAIAVGEALEAEAN